MNNKFSGYVVLTSIMLLLTTIHQAERPALAKPTHVLQSIVAQSIEQEDTTKKPTLKTPPETAQSVIAQPVGKEDAETVELPLSSKNPPFMMVLGVQEGIEFQIADQRTDQTSTFPNPITDQEANDQLKVKFPSKTTMRIWARAPLFWQWSNLIFPAYLPYATAEFVDEDRQKIKFQSFGLPNPNNPGYDTCKFTYHKKDKTLRVICGSFTIQTTPLAADTPIIIHLGKSCCFESFSIHKGIVARTVLRYSKDIPDSDKVVITRPGESTMTFVKRIHARTNIPHDLIVMINGEEYVPETLPLI